MHPLKPSGPKPRKQGKSGQKNPIQSQTNRTIKEIRQFKRFDRHAPLPPKVLLSPNRLLFSMNTLEKLRVLGGGTKWDICTPTSKGHAPKNNDSRIGAPYSAGVCRSFTPDDRCVSLLKVLNSYSFFCSFSISSLTSTR